jgi:post-segregation antitoxin (ccd killing protein)
LKRNVTIRIDSDVVDKSKELGLNISRVCENCLKIAIGQMKGFYMKNDNREGSETNNILISWCGDRGLNPGRPTP